MSDPEPEEAPLDTLSDDYIRDLEPENQRYDITLAQDFVVSVLPNGIKTWAFIYDFQGRHRRKTLGVFPEMNFDDAKAALEKARASMLRMDEPTVAPNEFGQRPAVLGGSSYNTKKKRQPINWLPLLKLLGGVIAVCAVGLVGFKLIEKMNQPPVEDAAPAPPNLPFALDPPEDAKTPAPADTPAPATTAPEPAQTAEPRTTAPTPPAASTPSSQRTPATTAPAAAPSVAPDPTPERAASSQANAPSANTPSASRVSTTPAAPSRPVSNLTTTTKATAFGGRVSRSRLTSQVENLEPTDTLGPEISYKNSGFTRVFYFTELREFSDGDIVHRWSLNGEIVDEVVLKVRKSWRWRTYSNKDVTPGLTGEWTVETIDATGKILDTETFTYGRQ